MRQVIDLSLLSLGEKREEKLGITSLVYDMSLLMMDVIPGRILDKKCLKNVS